MEIVRLEGLNTQWTATQDSAANAAQTLTKAAVAGKKHCITALSVAVSGAAAAADITVTLKDGATVIWKGVVGTGARGMGLIKDFLFPLVLSENSAANLEVAAGGASVVTTANLTGYTL